VVRVRGVTVADEFGVDARSAGSGVLEFLH
jgi:hypothetical protein